MGILFSSEIAYDNCKDCKSRCIYAGQDRDFIYKKAEGSCKLPSDDAKDFVRVVRCHNCKFEYKGNCNHVLNKNIVVGMGHFCSYGKPKEK